MIDQGYFQLACQIIASMAFVSAAVILFVAYRKTTKRQRKEHV